MQGAVFSINHYEIGTERVVVYEQWRTLKGCCCVRETLLLRVQCRVAQNLAKVIDPGILLHGCAAIAHRHRGPLVLRAPANAVL